jgi:hypothetical protein
MAKGNSSRQPVHPWLERIARVGYATKGAVYFIVGALAVMAALGVGGQTTDTRGAFNNIADRPFGRIMLGAVAVGLVGYVVWRFTQAIVDTEGKGKDLKAVTIRSGYAGSALIHTGLAASAARVAFGGREPSSESSHKSRTADLIQLPFGPLLVGLVGVGFIGFGLYQIYKGYSRKFRKRLEVGEMDSRTDKWVTRCGQIGLAARGIVFCIIGYFLIRAALDYNPSEVRGLGGALQSLAEQPFGKVLLAVVAAGLTVYGIYMILEAKYHRIRVD